MELFAVTAAAASAASQEPWWTSSVSGLVGAVLGGAAVLFGTQITQGAIDRRERADRDERESRVRALFKSYAESVALILTWQIERALVRDLDEFDRRLAPLKRATAEVSLFLTLKPEVIEKLTYALDLVDLNLRTARRETARHEARIEKAQTQDEEARIEGQLREALKAIFRRSSEAFDDALLALGSRPRGREQPPPDDPVAPLTHVYVDELENE
jgi:hypothetical protein